VIEHVLKSNFYSYEKGPFFHEILSSFLGGGIFNADGEQWKGQRKTASWIFNVRNFRDFMVKVFTQECAQLLEIFKRASESREIVDAQDLFLRFTLESFGRIGFGIELNNLGRYREGDLSPVPFAAAFDKSQSVVDHRFLNPWWKWTDYLTGAHSELKRCSKVIDGMAYSVIERRRQDPKRHQYDDLLSRFMDAKKDDGSSYSDKELRDVVINMIMYVPLVFPCQRSHSV
jgi:cytochrome P450